MQCNLCMECIHKKITRKGNYKITGLNNNIAEVEFFGLRWIFPLSLGEDPSTETPKALPERCRQTWCH